MTVRNIKNRIEKATVGGSRWFHPNAALKSSVAPPEGYEKVPGACVAPAAARTHPISHIKSAGIMHFRINDVSRRNARTLLSLIVSVARTYFLSRSICGTTITAPMLKEYAAAMEAAMKRDRFDESLFRSALARKRKEANIRQKPSDCSTARPEKQAIAPAAGATKIA